MALDLLARGGLSRVNLSDRQRQNGTRCDLAGCTPRAPPPRVSSQQQRSLALVDKALAEIRGGKMVILTDDEDRENEGDLVMAAEKVTPKRSTSWRATAGTSACSLPPRRAPSRSLMRRPNSSCSCSAPPLHGDHLAPHLFAPAVSSTPPASPKSPSAAITAPSPTALSPRHHLLPTPLWPLVLPHRRTAEEILRNQRPAARSSAASARARHAGARWMPR